MFPGQGTQKVGMGRDLAERFPEARATFAAVDEALGVKLSRLMWEGPEDELTLTHNAQPAILAHSAAVGMTHWTQMAAGAGVLEGPAPVFFFAPDRMAERNANWGAAKFDQNVADAWVPFARWTSN